MVFVVPISHNKILPVEIPNIYVEAIYPCHPLSFWWSDQFN